MARFYVSYSSLPEKFRQQLKIPEIEKLNEFGALRLYAHFFNVFREGPLLPKPDDFSGCGPIQPGGGCLKSQRLYGEMEIVATTGLFEETEQILKVAREKFGPNFDEAIVKGWVGEFEPNRKFELFSYKLNIGLLLPITPKSGGYYVHYPTMEQNLTYIYRDLDRDKLPIKTLADLQTLSASIEDGESKGQRYYSISIDQYGPDPQRPNLFQRI